jgi:hypothetical protein
MSEREQPNQQDLVFVNNQAITEGIIIWNIPEVDVAESQKMLVHTQVVVRRVVEHSEPACKLQWLCNHLA